LMRSKKSIYFSIFIKKSNFSIAENLIHNAAHASSSLGVSLGITVFICLIVLFF